MSDNDSQRSYSHKAPTLSGKSQRSFQVNEARIFGQDAPVDFPKSPSDAQSTVSHKSVSDSVSLFQSDRKRNLPTGPLAVGVTNMKAKCMRLNLKKLGNVEEKYFKAAVAMVNPCMQLMYLSKFLSKMGANFCAQCPFDKAAKALMMN